MATMLRESDALSSRQDAPWLTLVGLGEDGATGLCREALTALNDADTPPDVQAPPARVFPWLWVLVGGAAILVVAGTVCLYRRRNRTA